MVICECPLNAEFYRYTIHIREGRKFESGALNTINPDAELNQVVKTKIFSAGKNPIIQPESETF